MESGTKLGHYEILSLLGKGGMGEVWRARDTKLGRGVAIKTLPEEFAEDADRLARFEREARLLASLNHPNIAAIHGFEEDKGTHFIVLELVEGDTLAHGIKRGAIPVEESLTLALQIAEALEAAHEKGVFHRDLKPLNIKVTPEGKVKVLDFGLAKAFAGDNGVDLSQSPTLSMEATEQGIILGTAAYMSPEQVRGETADKRVDVWAFGCVLFEMLTGRRVFEGRGVSDVLASVLKTDPDWISLPLNLHPRIRTLLERCLEKEVKDRYSGIADARVDIQKALSDPVLVPPVAEAVRAEPQSKLSWLAVTCLAVILTALGTWVVMRPDPPRPVRLAIIHPGPENVGGNAFDSNIALAPDGRRIAYVASSSSASGNELPLYLRALDQLEPTLLSDSARTPFFSPDGAWVGFVGNNRRLMKAAVTGGPAVEIGGPSGGARGASWGPDDTSIFARANSSIGLLRISAAGGGEPETLTTPDPERNEINHLFPEFLPGGRAVLFTIAYSEGSTLDSQIAVLDLDTVAYRTLIPGGGNARYASSGHIVYVVEGAFWADPFDLESLEIVGTPAPVLDGVATGASGAASFGLSPNGTLAYVRGFGAADTSLQQTLVWVDRNGAEEPIAAEPRPYWHPRISPDGRRVALDLDLQGEQTDIFVWDLEDEMLTRLTFDRAVEQYPVWTPDGERIAYRQGADIYWKASDNTGGATSIAENPGEGNPFFFSPDGTRLVFAELDDIGIIDVNSGSGLEWLLRSEFRERNPELSPDGRWMAYQSDDTGDFEVYVQPFPNVDGGRWQISNSGESPPFGHAIRANYFTFSPTRLMC